MNNDLGPTIRLTDPDFPRVQARRFALMQARQQAVARKDFDAMNEITMRLAKLPVPVVR